MINLNFGVWQRVARTLCSKRGLRIEYAEGDDIKKVGAEAWTTGKVIYVRRPLATWSELEFKLWLYFMAHEIGHNTPTRTRMFEVINRRKPVGLLQYVNNVLEDHVQEFEFQRDELTVRNVLRDGRLAFYQFLLDKPRQPADPQAPTLFSWDAEVREHWLKGAASYGPPIRGEVSSDPRVEVWLQRLRDGDYASVLKDTPDPEDVFELSERVVREVFEMDPDEQQAGGKGETSKEKGEPGDESGKGEPGDETGEGAAAAADGKAEPGDGKDGKPQAGEGRANYDELLNHNHNADKRGGNDKQSRGLTINYDEYFKRREFGQFTPDLKGLRVYDTTAGEYPGHNTSARYPNPISSSILSRKVGRYMQARSKDRRLHGQKSGKLSNKSLYRLRVPGIGEAKKRVFHQKIVNKSKDVAVFVGVDASGSMGSAKSQRAIEAVCHMHEVISKQLRIPLEIAAFSVQSEAGVHVLVQKFGKTQTREHVETTMKKIMPFQGCNRDGEFLLWARERLLRQQASRHILIMLSDGQPIHRPAGDVAGFTKEVCTQIDADPRIDMHGIGILSDSVTHFYESNDVLYHEAELEEKLLNVLKNKIIINL